MVWQFELSEKYNNVHRLTLFLLQTCESHAVKHFIHTSLEQLAFRGSVTSLLFRSICALTVAWLKTELQQASLTCCQRELMRPVSTDGLSYWERSGEETRGRADFLFIYFME